MAYLLYLVSVGITYHSSQIESKCIEKINWIWKYYSSADCRDIANLKIEDLSDDDTYE